MWLINMDLIVKHHNHTNLYYFVREIITIFSFHNGRLGEINVATVAQLMDKPKYESKCTKEIGNW